MSQLLLSNSELGYLLRSGLVLGGVFLLVLFNTDFALLNALIVLGHAHFLLAYKNQRWSIKKATIFLAILSVLILLFLQVSNPYAFFLVTTATLFTLHNTLDEINFHNKAISPAIFLFSFPLVFTSLAILNTVYPLPSLVFKALVASSALISFGALLFLAKQSSSLQENKFVILKALIYSSVLCIFYYFNEVFTAIDIFAFLVLSHVFIWYFEYYIKIKPHPQKLRRYKRDVFWCNALFIILFFFTIFSSSSSLVSLLGNFVFNFTHYNLWALIHIILSFRFIKFL